MGIRFSVWLQYGSFNSSVIKVYDLLGYLESSVRFQFNYFVFRFGSGNKVKNKLISEIISYFSRFQFCSDFGLKSQKSKNFVLNISFFFVFR